MDEATSANINANMIDAVRVGVEMSAKEHEITRPNSIQWHWMRRTTLLLCSAWDFKPGALVHVKHESAAIETVRVGPAEMIGSSDQLGSRVRNRSATSIFAIGRTWHVAAAGCHGESNEQEHAAKAEAQDVFHASDPSKAGRLVQTAFDQRWRQLCAQTAACDYVAGGTPSIIEAGCRR